jgi:hypothetical protein
MGMKESQKWRISILLMVFFFFDFVFFLQKKSDNYPSCFFFVSVLFSMNRYHKKALIWLFSLFILTGNTLPFEYQSRTIRLPITKLYHTSHKQNTLFHRSANHIHKASLYNDDGSEYLVQIGVGTPPQNFTVSLDTGRLATIQFAIKCSHFFFFFFYIFIFKSVLIFGFLP